MKSAHNKRLQISCYVFRTIPRDVSFNITLVAGLRLVQIAGGRASRYTVKSCARSKAVPGHVVGTTTAITSDRWQSGCIEGTSRGRDTGHKARSCCCTSTTGTNTSEMPYSTTVITFLITTVTLQPQGRTFRLDVTNTTTRIALFGGNGTRGRTSRGLVAGLPTIIA